MKAAQPDPSAIETVLARQLAALAHPVRLNLLRHLGAGDACCVKDLVARVGLAQSTVSQHLRTLVDAGLVDYQPQRQSSRYSLNVDMLRDLAAAVGKTLDHCCGRGCAAATDHPPIDQTRSAGIAAPPAGHKDI